LRNLLMLSLRPSLPPTMWHGCQPTKLRTSKPQADGYTMTLASKTAPKSPWSENQQKVVTDQGRVHPAPLSPNRKFSRHQQQLRWCALSTTRHPATSSTSRYASEKGHAQNLPCTPCNSTPVAGTQMKHLLKQKRPCPPGKWAMHIHIWAH
jgi:hypothetical protein